MKNYAFGYSRMTQYPASCEFHERYSQLDYPSVWGTGPKQGIYFQDTA